MKWVPRAYEACLKPVCSDLLCIMSSNALSVKRSEGRRRNCALKTVEDLLASWQQTLAEEQERQQELLETSIILAENLYALERLQAVYDQHQHWLAAGGPAPDNQGQQGAQQQQQPRQAAHDDAHWVLFLLETASWEQLQMARRLTVAEWGAYQNTYCKELLLLLELSHRDVALQQELMDVAGVDLTPESMPAVYDWVSSCCQSHGSSGGGATNTSNRPATWDVIVDKLKSTGTFSSSKGFMKPRGHLLAWLHTHQRGVLTDAVVPYCCLLLPAYLQDG